MEKLKLSTCIDFLKELRNDALFDMKQDWNEDKDLMSLQIQALTTAIGSLEFITSKPDSQFFQSITSID